MSKIYLYSNTRDNAYVTKNPTYLSSFECDLMSGTSIERPMVVITSDKINDYMFCNYCYIEKFKRYYYCHFTLLENKQVMVECVVDPLASFDKYVRALNCLVVRQEYKYNDYIVDDCVISRVGTITEKKKVGSIGYNTNYVLTVTGGGE